MKKIKQTSNVYFYYNPNCIEKYKINNNIIEFTRRIKYNKYGFKLKIIKNE